VAAEEEAAALRAAAADPDVLEALVRRRTAGEPLAWLVGGVEFCGLRVRVDRGVYVPRRQTEALAERAASLLPSEGVAVDLCTGAGAVAVVLRDRQPAATVFATDIDPAAVACARANGVDALLGDLDGPLPPTLHGAVDVITAVVPYVPTDELEFLPRDVLAFEPRQALDGGRDGVEVLSVLAASSTRWLRSGGWLLLEIGGRQAVAVTAAMEEAGFGEITLLRDEEGDDRAIVGRKILETPATAPPRDCR
jgi:release factor glutamine methyltransferase